MGKEDRKKELERKKTRVYKHSHRDTGGSTGGSCSVFAP